MIRAKKILWEGQALLEKEIIALVRQGKTMNSEDGVLGYVINPTDNNMCEVEVGALAVIDGSLQAFLHRPDEKYTEDEAREYMHNESGNFLPGWFTLNEGFYGLRLPTLMNIADALD